MSFFNHYPNLSEFKPLSRSETNTEEFGQFNIDGAPLPLYSAGPFPYEN